MSKPKQISIGREVFCNTGGFYCVLRPDSKLERACADGCCYRWEPFRIRMCDTDFEKLTGVKMRKGTVAKFKLIKVTK